MNEEEVVKLIKEAIEDYGTNYNYVDDTITVYVKNTADMIFLTIKDYLK